MHARTSPPAPTAPDATASLDPLDGLQAGETRPSPLRRAIGSVRRPIEVLTGADDGRVLRTDRLVVRPLRHGDRAALIDAARASRSALERFLPLFHPGESDAQMFERHLDLTATTDRSARGWRRVIIAPEPGGNPARGRLVGGVNVINIRRGLDADADINVWIDRDARGLGYAKEAVAAAVEHALSPIPTGLGLTRVNAGICTENGPSLSLFRALGAVATGRREPMDVAGRCVMHEMFEFNETPAPVATARASLLAR